MTRVLLGLLLLAGAAAPQTRCWVVDAHASPRTYACGASPAVAAPAGKAWFTAHCHRWANLADDAVATCDAFPPAHAQPPYAGPESRFKRHMKAFWVGAAGVGVVVFCAYTGGCGFLGGQ